MIHSKPHRPMMTKEERSVFETIHAFLSFGEGNAKLNKRVATFSLPSGWTCPGASVCRCHADRITGKLTDGPECKFRCFSASGENRLPSVRKARWKNWDVLLEKKTTSGMADLIELYLPTKFDLIRLHVAGDVFSEAYFLAWCAVARNHPGIIFYAYTKSLPFWVNNIQRIPSNLRLTASKGGNFDHLIAKHSLVYAEVVFSVEEAAEKGLEIDHDDSHAINPVKPFALLLHATQPKGTKAAAAWEKIKRTVGGYSPGKSRANAIPPEDLKFLSIKVKP